MKLITDTPTIEASQPFTLTLTISDANSNAPVTAFDEIHPKLLHLIIVSKDLGEFMHLHPDYQVDRSFVSVVLKQYVCRFIKYISPETITEVQCKS